ncbi:MAG: TylF/MycF/NovP-related O-methyltransferase [Bacteroidota bacterium]|nr:TylF/MycF/NovP-related O-methyltransferase [Bacteroidota bacterium]
MQRILNKNLINSEVKNSVLNGRGNLDDNFPSDFSPTEKENLAFIKGLTMTSIERQVVLSRAIDYLVKNQIQGDIVECGVWKGGSMMLIAKRLMQLKDSDRNLFLFDTFEGMSAPDERDFSPIDNLAAQDLLNKENRLDGNNVWCYSSLDEVKSNLKKTNYPEGKLFYFKGKVEETLPEPMVGQIALLRLDTDWYESTRHELEVLYDKIVTGGILIIDDYGHWSGSKKAVDEFIEKRNLKIFLNRIDYTGRIAIKL